MLPVRLQSLLLLGDESLRDHDIGHAPHGGGGQRVPRGPDIEAAALTHVPHADAVDAGVGAGLPNASEPVGPPGVGVPLGIASGLLQDEGLAQRVGVARQHGQGVKGVLVVGVGGAHVDLDQAVDGGDVQTGVSAVAIGRMVNETPRRHRPVHAGAAHHAGQTLVEGDEVLGRVGFLIGVIAPIDVGLAGQGDVDDVLAGAVGATSGERACEQRRDVGAPVEILLVRVASRPDRRVPYERQVQDDAHAGIGGRSGLEVHLLVLALGIAQAILEAGLDDVGQTHDGHAHPAGVGDPLVRVRRPVGGGDDELAALVGAVAAACWHGAVVTRMGRVLGDRGGGGFRCWRIGHHPDRNG